MTTGPATTPGLADLGGGGESPGRPGVPPQAPGRSAGGGRLFTRPLSPIRLVVGTICLVLVLLIVLPLVGTVLRVATSEGFLEAALAELGRDDLVRVLLNTVLTVGVSTLLAVVIGTAFAWLNERSNARMGWASDILPVVSLLVPSIAGAIGWVLLAAPTAGFLNVGLQSVASRTGLSLPVLSVFTWPGLILVYSLYMIPQTFLTVAAALRNVDPALEEAARINGCGQWRTLRTITLPVIRPAILSGGLLALVYGVALFSVPLIIGTQAGIDVLTVRIVRLLTTTFPPQLAAAIALSALVLVPTTLLWWLNGRLSRRGNFATVGGRAAARERTVLSRPARWAARTLMVLYIALSCVLPLGALLLVSLQGFWSGRVDTPLSLDNYREVFAAGTQTGQALRNSVLLAVLSAVILMALAVLVAYQVTSTQSSRFSSVVDTVTKIPATVSHVVIAIALVATLAGPPVNLNGTRLLLVVAFIVLYIPQATASAQSSLVMVGKELSEASLVSGHGPSATLWRVVLPLMRSGLVAGGVFVFVLVIGDITASAVLASPSTPVVGFTILSIFQNGSYPLLAALGTVISLVSSVIVLTSLLVLGRRAAHSTR